MTTQSQNPLARHFRQPILYIKLPSQGRWYPDNSIEIPVTGEVPIYAMTAKDELTIKTPDALMNGGSTVSVIESCCPAIKDAWKMPSVDLDPILIAIRIATYGNRMDFVAVCPHCKHSTETALDLEALMGKIVLPNWDEAIKIDGLEIALKPQNYEDFNKNNMINFEEQRIIQVVQNQDISEEERNKQFETLFHKLLETGTNQLIRSISGITLEDGTVVTNIEFIKEFLDNCDQKFWVEIKKHLENIRNQNSWNQVDIICENEECGKEFTTPFVFEQSNFFALGF